MSSVVGACRPPASQGGSPSKFCSPLEVVGSRGLSTWTEYEPHFSEMPLWFSLVPSWRAAVWLMTHLGQTKCGARLIQSDIAVNCAKGARDFVKLQPDWLGHAHFCFLSNSHFAGEGTEMLRPCYLQRGDTFLNCHQEE